MTHPLLVNPTTALVEDAVSAHLGRRWRVTSVVDRHERSSHPAAILEGDSLAIFAKLVAANDAREQVDSELAGLRLIGDLAEVRVPVPIGSGRLDLPDGSYVLMLEALDERIDRSPEDWRAIGQVLGCMHQVVGQSYGAAVDGYLGPLRMDNRHVPSDSWLEFYATRRVLPWLRTAREVGAVDAGTAVRVETLVGRLAEFSGPEPEPRLLHGDAQHHNFVSTNKGAVVIDSSPFFGHPELDLALLDYFSAVPDDTWAGYSEVRAIDDGLGDRRELWRVFAYLGAVSVDSSSEFGRLYLSRLDGALRRYVG